MVRFGVVLLAPLLYLAIAVTVAALLAYGVHLATLGSLNFSLVVSRGAQVVLLLTLIPLCRALGLGWPDIGLPGNGPKFWKQFLVGLAIGTAILSLHVALMLYLQVFKPHPELRPTLVDLSSAVPAALASGLLVATMEELIFRGVMFSVLARFGRPLCATLVTASYYALLHFVKNDLRPAGDNVKWYSGFTILSDGIDYLMTETRLDALLALFCAGLFLAVVRWLRSDGLALCIGIHAGWVLVIKVARRYTNPDPHKPLAYLVSPYDQVIGYGAAGWITLVLAVTAYLAWRRRQARAAH
jgi:membrane protease YdiL (CAAX protease family)